MASEHFYSMDAYDIGISMEEEKVTASVSSIPGTASSSPVVSEINVTKCLWCHKISEEKESVLGLGLDTFKQHCVEFL